MEDIIPCTAKALATYESAQTAIDINPVNQPGLSMEPQKLAVVTSKYWSAKGVKLTVGFLDNASNELKNRILSHMNAWNQYSNVEFVLSNQNPQVRITFANDGYWSYIGTDILHIPAAEPTMNLQGFSMNTPESEYRRVVRHETGHTLGFPHEHMRQEIVNLLDVQKTIDWGERALGWDRDTVIQQILTPLSESSLMGTPNADVDSIMCYQLPAEITINGQPIRGGTDIDKIDQNFVAKIYPKATVPPKPGPPTGDGSFASKADMIFNVLMLRYKRRPKDYGSIAFTKLLFDQYLAQNPQFLETI